VTTVDTAGERKETLSLRRVVSRQYVAGIDRGASHERLRDVPTGHTIFPPCAHSSTALSLSVPTSVPNLRLDGLAVDVDAPGGELDADCRLGLEVELVASETRENWRMSAP
jgi:hypothetical protein